VHKLPLKKDLNSVKVLIQLNKSNNKLGELNGMLRLLPNPQIILNAIILGESKSSSEIENIFTTYDDLYKEMTASVDNQSAKEVLRYRTAMNVGADRVKEREMITVNDIVLLHSIIDPGKGDIRKLPGTVIMNTSTQEIVHTPPQSELEIIEYLSNLEQYINNPSEYDPLIDMAIIHYQFEAIHPFYDGNGRTGRVLNIIYLMLKDIIKLPILYLSRYVNRNREEYYNLLKRIEEDENRIEDFVIFMLKAVEETTIFTIEIIELINLEILQTKFLVREKLSKIYTAEMVDVLFLDFYTKNEYFKKRLGLSRNTASKYLNQLVELGVLSKEQVGKEIIYKNMAMFNIVERW
jgi:Fic family protein